MKLLLLFIGAILYGRAGTVAAESMIEAPKSETGAPGDAEDIQVAQPPPQAFKGAEDFVAIPRTKRFNRTDKSNKQGGEAVNTVVNVKPGKPQILPMPIAVGEPSPQKPIVFTLDGYLYEGAQKIASYRIDFRGVHFKKEKKNKTKDEVDVTPEDNGDDGEKATTTKQGNGATTEAQTPVDGASSTTESMRPTEKNVNGATTEVQTSVDDADLTPMTERMDVGWKDPTKPTPVNGGDSEKATEKNGGKTTKVDDVPAPTKTAAAVTGGEKATEVQGEEVTKANEDAATNPEDKEKTTKAPTIVEEFTVCSFSHDVDGSGQATTHLHGVTNEEKKTTKREAEVASSAAPIASEAVGSTAAPVVPEDVASTKAPIAPGPDASTGAPVAPEAAASTKAPVAAEGDPSTKARIPRESGSSAGAPVAPNDGASSTVAASNSGVLFTGVPPKPEIWQDKEGKCTVALTFSFDAKAGRCLANKTYVCKEEEWAAVLKKTFGECMKSAPKVIPADNNVKTACGLGKVFAKVPGEPSADLYGKLCKDDFCPKEATCVQEQTAAHCCIMPMWAHYG